MLAALSPCVAHFVHSLEVHNDHRFRDKMGLQADQLANMFGHLGQKKYLDAYHVSGKLQQATRRLVTPKCGLVWEPPQNALNAGLGIIVICPDA